MGIRYLNQFLKSNAKRGINLRHFNTLRGAHIVVDISIYMYRFITEGSLIENMYLLLSVFKHYEIVPVFIFDGKPPEEKKELLKMRKETKQEAEEEYNAMKAQLDKTTSDMERQELISIMDSLKKQFVVLSKDNVETVKHLIRCYGFTYYDAIGEADELCASLVISGKAWACMSEDMDMFIYGCPRVIRYVSVLNHTGILYELDTILEELNMPLKDLKEICVLSGTDYNVRKTEQYTHNLKNTIKLYRKYVKYVNDGGTNLTFYEWLNEFNSGYISDPIQLSRTHEMFNLESRSAQLDRYQFIKIGNGPTQKNELRRVLATDGFLFGCHNC